MLYRAFDPLGGSQRVETRLISPRIWKPLDGRQFGFMRVLSDSIRRMEHKYPFLLPDLRRGASLIVTSDYSGHHRSSRCEAYAFLVSDMTGCAGWEQRRQLVRGVYLDDARRMSYKNLNDGQRRAALRPFLEAANLIRGVLVIMVVDKSVHSLFRTQREGQARPVRSEFAGWSRSIVERLLRAVHFVSFFIAGLSEPDQDVLWLTDDDAIAQNEKRLRQLVNVFGRVASHYLSHDLGHIRIGTTQSDTGRRDVEDLAAIPDLLILA